MKVHETIMTCVIIGGEDNAVSDSTAAHGGHEDLSSSNTDGCIITALKGDRAFTVPPPISGTHCLCL